MGLLFHAYMSNQTNDELSKSNISLTSRVTLRNV